MAARILIIEDNANNLELMRYLLQAFGYTPLLAQDGDFGLSLIKSEQPDLILCDIQLPLLDGFSIAAFVKNDISLTQIPLIAVTALAMVGDKEKMLKAGFDGYIAKPITPETFISEVEFFLPDYLKSIKEQQ